MPVKRPAVLLIALASAGALRAQEPAPREREWCQDPALCVDDRLEVVFEGGGSVLEIDGFVPGTKVTATVVMDTRSDQVQGWSYSVRHDPRFLRFLGARLFIWTCDFCNQITPRPLFECIDARCSTRKEGSGFISAVVLSLFEMRVLELGRNSLLAADHELVTDPGPEGTFIEFTDRLALSDGPPTAINITVDGRSRSPRTVIDGWVKRRGEPTAFHRGDPNGDGRSSICRCDLPPPPPRGGRTGAPLPRVGRLRRRRPASRTRSPSSTGSSGAGRAPPAPGRPRSPAGRTRPRARRAWGAARTWAADPRTARRSINWS